MMDSSSQAMEKQFHVVFFASFTILCIVPGYICQDRCLDHKGQWVPPGERYFPLGTDPCTQCTCVNGTPEMCISVFCSPPENCRQYHALNDKCCQFVCLDVPPYGGNVTENNKDESLTATNLGLRLVASAVTSFLILALLLFMIHRLRQRRLLLVIRRLNGQGLDSMQANGQQYALDDEGSVGYFNGHDQLDFGGYDEPPPPYCFWKPPETYIPTGEAPPPYEATEGPNQNNNNGLAELSQAPGSIESPKTECDEVTTQTIDVVGAGRHTGGHVTVVHLRGGVRVTDTRLCQEDITNGNLLPSTSRERDTVTNRESTKILELPSRIAKHRSLQESRHSPPLGARLDSLQATSAFNRTCSDPTTWPNCGSSTSTSPSSTTSSDPQSTISPSSSDSTTSPEVDFVRQGALEQPVVLGAIPENVTSVFPKSKFEKTLWRLKQLSHHRAKPKLRNNVTSSTGNFHPAEIRISRPCNLNLNSWVVAGIRVHTNPTCNETLDEALQESSSSSDLPLNLNCHQVAAPSVSVDNATRRHSIDSSGSGDSTGERQLSRTGSVCSETGERKLKQVLCCRQHMREGVFCNCTYVQQASGNNLRSSCYSSEGNMSES